MDKVLPKHWWAAGLISLSAAFCLGGYEFVRSTSNTLFKAAYGPENLPLAMALIPVVVFAVLYFYGGLLSSLGARRTLLVTTLGSGLALLLCYVGVKLEWRPAAAILYWVREAYVILLIEQYWSFLNSTLTHQSARKLNGPISGIASLGAVCGGLLISVTAVELGTEAMLLFAVVATIPGAFLSDWAIRKCGEPTETHPKQLGFDLLAIENFKKSKLCLYLLCLILVTQVVSAVYSLEFQTILQLAIPNADEQTAFSGKFFAGVNGLAFALQFFIAPMLMRVVPLKWIHMAIPFVHVATAIALLWSPSLAVAGSAYMLFKGFDYSLFRAAKEVLYIPLSFDIRYRVKEVIDVLGYRAGKGGVSLLIHLFKMAGVVLVPFYGWVALTCAALWLMIVTKIFAQPEVEAVNKPNATTIPSV